jgi:hypothetical protein
MRFREKARSSNETNGTLNIETLRGASAMAKIKPYLRRYTDISALISLLCKREITLLDPSSWDDKNDSGLLAIYQQKKGLQSVLALCFTQADERHHHWGSTKGTSTGVSIKFDTSLLLKSVKKHVVLRCQPVTYLTMGDMGKRKKTLDIDDLPFLKRSSYKDENEFRIIYDSRTEKLKSLTIPIPLECITRITLSPWLPLALRPSLTQVLRSIEGCAKLNIYRSTLVQNETFLECGRSASKR